MREKVQHFLLILLGTLVISTGIAVLLNNASYNPDFSMMDAISGATKKAHKANPENEINTIWEYSKDDVGLSGENYVEDVIVTEGTTYKVLKNPSAMENGSDIVLLSNKEDPEYQKAVVRIADHLEKQGYSVRIKEYNEIMMLSFVHAGRFSIFLMSEEAA